MAKHIIKTSPHKFFLLNRQELVKIGAIGALSGAVAMILTGWLGFGQMLINFRVGLIIALLLGLVLLLKQQVESALLIVVFSRDFRCKGKVRFLLLQSEMQGLVRSH